MKVILDSRGRIRSGDVAPTLTTNGNVRLMETYSIGNENEKKSYMEIFHHENGRLVENESEE